MATLRDIKLRIVGVKSTQQITKAMKMVAASKLRRAQEGIMNARPYARKISEMLSHLITDEQRANNPYIAEREIKNVAVVVVTADRGLCGGFNTNIIREAARFVNNDLGSGNYTVSMFCVGKKGYDFFSRGEYNIAGKEIGFFTSLRYETAINISNDLIKLYLEGKFDKIYLVYNEFKTIVQQKMVIEQFLPIPIKPHDDKNEPGAYYIYEPNQGDIFNYLLPKHLRAQMWRVLLESNAAEFGARMTAMDNATTNAKDLIRSLQLTYNKERQAAITKEILEIVSGANALMAG